jgi:hypothetical protein
MNYSRKYIQHLFVDLAVLGKVGSGYKINTKGVYLELDDSKWYQPASRWFRGDSRHSTMEKINSTIETTSLLVKEVCDYPTEMYMKMSSKVFLEKIYTIVKEAIAGLENLSGTYHKDITICSQLRFGILTLQQTCKDIENFLGIIPDDNSSLASSSLRVRSRDERIEMENEQNDIF